MKLSRSGVVAIVLLVLAALAAVLLVRRTRPAPEVAIQDGKTIDFSSGAPVVKDDAKEKAIIDAAVKEMEAAAKEVSFNAPAAKK